jgi:hypothetical protein
MRARLLCSVEPGLELVDELVHGSVGPEKRVPLRGDLVQRLEPLELLWTSEAAVSRARVEAHAHLSARRSALA